ncbi:hypothetical protein KBTX_03321 [wastewater metagenome]|uniref:Thioesterase domain-containing protein n=2 Tax=unclassified sequences TaxID=12908 RepID=A0A5B8RGI4_9ZZZZ|nr:PaaI family thioesterase [Arhodomonas sp. KWT]QEA06978.1 hypothetical protein KBTEX_03321 [uncultured organism]
MEMDLPAVQAFLAEHFPQGYGRVEAVGPLTARLRLAVGDEHLRPGGTVSGPTMMGLADTALYVAILANLGPVAQAVTTNLNANFLRRPPVRDLIAEARMLKLGKRLAVGEVTVFSDGDDQAVAHVTATYSIPPRETATA